ncbi:hypothetical protein VTN31DRAFT_4384 [Thermomyces dupontii]|uniref:uncharacterized protein n=1 Tax=Talaromyces thermophilus TaxID=28565 RepID=UPI003742B497
MTTTTARLPTLAVPGQQLGPTSTYAAGSGTHIRDGTIYASIPGTVVLEPSPSSLPAIYSKQSGSNNNNKATIHVSRSGVRGTLPTTTQKNQQQPAKKPPVKHSTLPAVDSTVLARVTRVQKRQATLSILVVLDDTLPQTSSSSSSSSSQRTDNDDLQAILSTPANPLNHNTADELRFQAVIRKEDVRAVEKDRVVMEEMFRVGDIVRATVISLGDQNHYYLTTARNDLGVVMARSEDGNMMFPASWREMKDPVTGKGELRKVARPF